jgi:hypothetical protein
MRRKGASGSRELSAKRWVRGKDVPFNGKRVGEDGQTEGVSKHAERTRLSIKLTAFGWFPGLSGNLLLFRERSADIVDEAGMRRSAQAVVLPGFIQA